MRAVVYSEPTVFDLVEVPTPEPGPGQVLVKVTMAGVCGTDLHLHVGEFAPRYPLTPGHEITGEVVAQGAGVLTPVEGQQVAIDNAEGCHHCPECRRGREVFCAAARAQGVTSPGGFAEYVLAPATHCYPVDDLDVERAVLAEPLSCVVHGIDAIAQPAGAHSLVFGAGPTGLLLAQLLRLCGAASVTVAAPTQFKLDLAEGYGLHPFLVDTGDVEATDRALLARRPQGYDVVADATGRVSVLEQAVRLVRNAGTIAVYGMSEEAARWSVSPYDIFRRELRIQGSFAQSAAFDNTLRWLRSPALHTDGLITHRFGLDQFAEALEATRSRDCLKAVIVP